MECTCAACSVIGAIARYELVVYLPCTRSLYVARSSSLWPRERRTSWWDSVRLGGHSRRHDSDGGDAVQSRFPLFSHVGQQRWAIQEPWKRHHFLTGHYAPLYNPSSASGTTRRRQDTHLRSEASLPCRLDVFHRYITRFPTPQTSFGSNRAQIALPLPSHDVYPLTRVQTRRSLLQPSARPGARGLRPASGLHSTHFPSRLDRATAYRPIDKSDCTRPSDLDVTFIPFHLKHTTPASFHFTRVIIIPSCRPSSS